MIFFKGPSYLLFILLALIYFACGFTIGFYQGYLAGQKDYLFCANKIFEENQ